jgi:hypothetical protein
VKLSLKRNEAADLLDKIRVMLAERIKPEDIEARLEKDKGIAPLQACGGEAHGNPFIDNCHGCAPRWGWTGPRLKVT